MTPISRRTIARTSARRSSSRERRDGVAALQPAPVELRLRRDYSQLLGEERHGERRQAVDEVQRRQLLAGEQEHAAERRLDGDERLPGAQQRPEAGRRRAPATTPMRPTRPRRG